MLATAAFAANMVLPQGLSVGVLHAAAVATTTNIAGMRSTRLATVAVCALALLGWLAAPGGVASWAAMPDLLLSWSTIGITAALVGHVKRLDRRHRLAEQQATRREAQFRQSVESNPTGMLLVDRQGLIVLVNSEALRLLGHARQTLEGQPIENLLPRTARDLHVWQRAAFLHEDAPRRMATAREVRAVHRNGHEVVLEVGLARIDTHEGTFVLATLTDPGERARAKRAQQAHELARRLLAAEEAQRRRMAREIHDALGQALTSLKLDIEWLAAHLPDEPADLHVRAIAMDDLAASTIEDVRRLSAELRPSILDDRGLLAAIRWQVGEFEKRSGLPCSLALPAEAIDWTDERCTVAFRVLQESLTNVSRHAQARHVAVSLRTRPQGDALLEVQDDGRGISVEEAAGPGALGLLGMRERALLHDGTLSVTGVSGAGTTVALSLPCGP
jgi:PAS domain S-box-containing protein